MTIKDQANNSAEIILRIESEVRTYSRQWPTVFAKAYGSTMVSESGKEFLDFFAGAGALNYGHNDSDFVDTMVSYLSEGNILHGLDMFTTQKAHFLSAFEEIILKPRNLNYKVQFTGPTGTNAVEAALKIARKYTGRTDVVHFTNSFHGVSLGALAVTGNNSKRKAAGVPLNYAITAPFDGYAGIDGLAWLESALTDPSSGCDLPAAVIVETIQGEGGINVASGLWLQRLTGLCRKHGIVLIIDDVQMGCGRTGEFFSFEFAGIIPDIVVLSKSISGSGLPMAIALLKPELDIWKPGEHNGTFRGNNLAFATATKALEKFWKDKSLVEHVEVLHAHIKSVCEKLCSDFPGQVVFRGRGLAIGLEFMLSTSADEVARAAFDRGLIVETCGARDEVVKLLPALTISEEQLLQGLTILRDAVHEVLSRHGVEPVVVP